MTSEGIIDPIELLKDYVLGSLYDLQQGKKIEQQGRKIVLEKDTMLAFHQYDGLGSGAIIRLPLETPTAWKVKGDDFATLGSLWCLLEYKDTKQIQHYLRKADEIGVQKLIDLKKEIVEYFTTNKSDSDMIDVHMRTQTLFSKNELKYRSQKGITGKPGESQPLKKREMKLNEKLQEKIEAEQKMSVNDFLNERELKVSNRNSILQSAHFNFLKVLQLGYERIESQDQQKRLDHVQKQIKYFQDREMNERQSVMKNKFLMGSNIDVFKNSQKLADININKALKKRSFLDEILRMTDNNYHGSSSQQGRPIIVVPGSTDYPGNICLKNAVQFLKDGTFIEPTNVKFASDQEKYENKKTFTKKIGEQEITFEVYDSTQSFSEKHWQRVVCLFTSGEVFQLKDWPPKDKDNFTQLSDKEKQIKQVNLFHRVKGFYLRFQDIIEPKVVKTWNVSRFVVQRNKRHTDITIISQIWKELELFLSKEKFKYEEFDKKQSSYN